MERVEEARERRVEVAEEARQFPLKKQEMGQPPHYIRYFSNKEGESDRQYNYEATLQDREFLSTFPAPPCTEAHLELMMNMFEKENWLQSCSGQQRTEGVETDEVGPFHSFAESLHRLGLGLPLGHCVKVYEARKV